MTTKASVVSTKNIAAPTPSTVRTELTTLKAPSDANWVRASMSEVIRETRTPALDREK